MWIGTNDAAMGPWSTWALEASEPVTWEGTLDQLAAVYDRLLAYALERAARALCVTPVVADELDDTWARRVSDVGEVVAAAVAAELRAALLDLAPAFAAARAASPTALRFTIDGVHLSETGAEVVAEAIARAIEDLPRAHGSEAGPSGRAARRTETRRDRSDRRPDHRETRRMEDDVSQETRGSDASTVPEAGALTAEQRTLLIEALPVQVSLMDETGTLLYWRGEDFVDCDPKWIGRHVNGCHAPASRPTIDTMDAAFRAGEKDVAVFWNWEDDRMLMRTYTAVRDHAGAYRGMLETMQDITSLIGITEERRELIW